MGRLQHVLERARCVCVCVYACLCLRLCIVTVWWCLPVCMHAVQAFLATAARCDMSLSQITAGIPDGSVVLMIFCEIDCRCALALRRCLPGPRR